MLLTQHKPNTPTPMPICIDNGFLNLTVTLSTGANSLELTGLFSTLVGHSTRAIYPSTHGWLLSIQSPWQSSATSTAMTPLNQ